MGIEFIRINENLFINKNEISVVQKGETGSGETGAVFTMNNGQSVSIPLEENESVEKLLDRLASEKVEIPV